MLTRIRSNHFTAVYVDIIYISIALTLIYMYVYCEIVIKQEVGMDGLKRLLLSRGVTLSRVSAKVSDPAKGFGLYYTSDFRSGDSIVEVPRETWEPYSAAAARNEFCSSATFQAMLDKVGGSLGIVDGQRATFEQAVCLTTKILSAKDTGISPYIAFLEKNSWPHDPTKPMHPLMLPFESLNLLSECAAYRGLVSRKRFHSIGNQSIPIHFNEKCGEIEVGHVLM